MQRSQVVVGSGADGEVASAAAAAIALASLREVEQRVRAVDEIRERVSIPRGRFAGAERGVVRAVRRRRSFVFALGGRSDASLDEVGVDALGPQRRAPDNLARFVQA